MAIDGMGHTLGDDKTKARIWTGIAGFLQQYLGAPPAPAPAASATQQQSAER